MGGRGCPVPRRQPGGGGAREGVGGGAGGCERWRCHAVRVRLRSPGRVLRRGGVGVVSGGGVIAGERGIVGDLEAQLAAARAEIAQLLAGGEEPSLDELRAASAPGRSDWLYAREGFAYLVGFVLDGGELLAEVEGEFSYDLVPVESRLEGLRGGRWWRLVGGHPVARSAP